MWLFTQHLNAFNQCRGKYMYVSNQHNQWRMSKCPENLDGPTTPTMR